MLSERTTIMFSLGALLCVCAIGCFQCDGDNESTNHTGAEMKEIVYVLGDIRRTVRVTDDDIADAATGDKDGNVKQLSRKEAIESYCGTYKNGWIACLNDKMYGRDASSEPIQGLPFGIRSYSSGYGQCREAIKELMTRYDNQTVAKMVQSALNNLQEH